MVARVTNSMISNTLMHNLNNNLRRIDNFQNQLSSGRKHANISDNPTALIFGQAARNRMTRVMHYQEMVSVSRSWLTQAEAGTRELSDVVTEVYEELVSAGSVKTPEDRQNLAKVVGQMRKHFVDTLNTSFGDRFVFGGYNTPGSFAVNRNQDGLRPFAINEEGDLLFNGFNTSQFDGLPASFFAVDLSREDDPRAVLGALIDRELDREDPNGDPLFRVLHDVYGSNDREDIIDSILMLHQLMGDVKSLEVGPGITMPITMNGMNVLFYATNDPATGAPIMRNTFNTISDIFYSLNGVPDPSVTTIGGPLASPPSFIRPAREESNPLGTDDLTLQIALAQGAQNHMLNLAAEIGGRQRRLDLLDARYERDLINYGEMRSDAEDADIAEVIMNMRMAETVYQAALSAGARVIQPTLMDFLR